MLLAIHACSPKNSALCPILHSIDTGIISNAYADDAHPENVDEHASVVHDDANGDVGYPVLSGNRVHAGDVRREYDHGHASTPHVYAGV
ncbi:MAG: hypothetical protein PHQ73_13190, partial [Gallionella sp.]|nr:hypothetical protein [Gallionella sp.]